MVLRLIGTFIKGSMQLARPEKYNWTVIKEAFESGFSRDEIMAKFVISKKLLTDKINAQKWVVKSDVNTVVNELKAQSLLIADNYSKHPEIEELFIAKLNTQKEDNELIGNNRKIAKLLQSVIVQQKNSINLTNIRNVSGVIRDIETMANPVNRDVVSHSSSDVIEVEIE